MSLRDARRLADLLQQGPDVTLAPASSARKAA